MVVIRLLPTGSRFVCDAVIYKQSHFFENILIVVAFYLLKLTTLPAKPVVLILDIHTVGMYNVKHRY